MQRKIEKIRNSKFVPARQHSGAICNFTNLRIALVVSEYNSDITFPMRDSALETLIENGVVKKNITVWNAPGGFEIPIICQQLAMSKKYQGLVAIGCVIKGDTDHYVYISNEATRGIMDVMLKYNIPITNAILTVNNLEQAKLRSVGANNKGIEGAIALLKVLNQ